MAKAIEIWETNAGQLIMFETDEEDNVQRCWEGFEYGEEGNLKGFESFDLDLLDESVSVSDMNMYDLYDYVNDYRNATDLIATWDGDELGIYPEDMGVAGKRAFGIEEE